MSSCRWLLHVLWYMQTKPPPLLCIYCTIVLLLWSIMMISSNLFAVDCSWNFPLPPVSTETRRPHGTEFSFLSFLFFFGILKAFPMVSHLVHMMLNREGNSAHGLSAQLLNRALDEGWGWGGGDSCCMATRQNSTVISSPTVSFWSP